jgi:hypothetical protein
VGNQAKLFILLFGAFLSYLLAYNINFASILPDPEFTQIPFILAPLIITAAISSKAYFVKNHFLFTYSVILPITVLFLGVYLFGFVLRNLH